MRTKSDAAGFLRSLAEPSPAEPGKPPLILVRSTPELKAFVASALEYLEGLGNVLEQAESNPEKLGALETDLAGIRERARSTGCHNTAQALHFTALALALRRAWSTSRIQKHSENFNGLVRNLSAMLLRLYIQGHDADNHDELAKVQGCVQRMAPLTTLPRASTAGGPPEQLN